MNQFFQEAVPQFERRPGIQFEPDLILYAAPEAEEAHPNQRLINVSPFLYNYS